jgi:hypothetical protein
MAAKRGSKAAAKKRARGGTRASRQAEALAAESKAAAYEAEEFKRMSQPFLTACFGIYLVYEPR